jgi:hypothetical protein
MMPFLFFVFDEEYDRSPTDMPETFIPVPLSGLHPVPSAFSPVYHSWASAFSEGVRRRAQIDQQYLGVLLNCEGD